MALQDGALRDNLQGRELTAAPVPTQPVGENLTDYQVAALVKRVDSLRAKVNASIEILWEQKYANAWYQRITGTTLLIASVLAPIFTASSGLVAINRVDLFKVLGVSLSALVAILVGVRRLYQFEARSRTTSLSIRDLQEAREKFRDVDDTVPFGSAEWITAYRGYRDSYFKILRQATLHYNSTLIDTAGQESIKPL
jgi:hypothetical protein